MKAFLKFTLVFLLGAAAAITITSFFLRPRVTALISHIGSKEAQWSLEDFAIINQELDSASSAAGLDWVVIPRESYIYEIRCYDKNLKARFGFEDRAAKDALFTDIDTRMSELRDNSTEN